MLWKNQICYFLALVITDLHTIMCIQFHFLFALSYMASSQIYDPFFASLVLVASRIGSHITI